MPVDGFHGVDTWVVTHVLVLVDQVGINRYRVEVVGRNMGDQADGVLGFSGGKRHRRGQCQNGQGSSKRNFLEHLSVPVIKKDKR
ncbi:hypothetical protein D3C72_2163990 [compost metagenome]